MGNEGAAGSSHATEHSADDKPLKKARYVWEVKGKYHLKESYKRPRNEAEIEETSVMDTSNYQNNCVDGHLKAESDSNTSTDSDTVNCDGRCCVNAMLQNSEVFMNSDDDEDDDEEVTLKDITDDVPLSLTAPNPKNEDYLLKWQARQVAKGFVDNTINRVLEQWTLAPFDASDLVENCDNDGHVEDEGILMAIQSHGLRQDSQQFSSRGGSTGFERNSGNPVAYEDAAKSTLDNIENVHNERTKQSNQKDYEKSLEVDDQMDFLSAAVSVAISEKGLSSCSYK